MLFLGLAITLAAVVLFKLRAATAEQTAPLGWMSDRWLAEYRASERA
jgi:hypothetical protein